MEIWVSEQTCCEQHHALSPYEKGCLKSSSSEKLLSEKSTTVVYTALSFSENSWFDEQGEIRRSEWRKRITIPWKLIRGTYKKARFSTNHGAMFPPVHQTTEYRQTIRVVYTTVVDPSHFPKSKTHQSKPITRNSKPKFQISNPKTQILKPKTRDLKPWTHPNLNRPKTRN